MTTEPYRPDSRRKIAYAREPEIISRYESGETLSQLGTAYGMTPFGIRKVLIRNGVERRPQGRAVRARADA